MKKTMFMISGLMMAVSSQAVEFQDFAKITKVEPQHTSVVQTVQECHNERVQERIPGAAAEKSYTGTILGGIVGGVVGNRFGKGNGRTVATAAGAVAGAMIGDNVANKDAAPAQPDQVVTKDVQVCNPVNKTVDQINGYKVYYTYQGKQDFFMSPNQPQSQKIPVAVSINPMMN